MSDTDPNRTNVSFYGHAQGNIPNAGPGDGNSGNGGGSNPYAGADLSADDFTTEVSDPLRIVAGPGNSVG